MSLPFLSVLADLQSASSYYKDLQSDYCSLFIDGKANGFSGLQILIVYFGGLQITPKHRNSLNTETTEKECLCSGGFAICQFLL